jgi:hypothetical protein
MRMLKVFVAMSATSLYLLFGIFNDCFAVSADGLQLLQLHQSLVFFDQALFDNPDRDGNGSNEIQFQDLAGPDRISVVRRNDRGFFFDGEYQRLGLAGVDIEIFRKLLCKRGVLDLCHGYLPVFNAPDDEAGFFSFFRGYLGPHLLGNAHAVLNMRDKQIEHIDFCEKDQRRCLLFWCQAFPRTKLLIVEFQAIFG